MINMYRRWKARRQGGQFPLFGGPTLEQLQIEAESRNAKDAPPPWAPPTVGRGYAAQEYPDGGSFAMGKGTARKVKKDQAARASRVRDLDEARALYVRLRPYLATNRAGDHPHDHMGGMVYWCPPERKPAPGEVICPRKVCNQRVRPLTFAEFCVFYSIPLKEHV